MRFYYTKKLPGVTALFCILWAVLIQSCKKTDNDVVIKDELTTTTPYSLTGKDNKQVARVFKELNKRGLSEGAFTRYGKLLWDKSIVLPYAHSQSPDYNTRAHNDIDSVVITPIVPENTKEVTAYLQAWIGDTVSLAVYTKHRYTALAFGNTLNNGIGEAEKLSLQFMHLNKLVFNYTGFKITDKRLFAGNLPVIDTAKAGVLIRLREPENHISSRLRYVELCVDIIRTNCTTPTAPQCMPTCDNCPGYCQTTETICTGWWEDDNPGGGEGPSLPDPGDGSGGGTNLPGSGDPCGGGRIIGARLPPCGGGGGGTGGGSGGGGWVPILPDEGLDILAIQAIFIAAGKALTMEEVDFLNGNSTVFNELVSILSDRGNDIFLHYIHWGIKETFLNHISWRFFKEWFYSIEESEFVAGVVQFPIIVTGQTIPLPDPSYTEPILVIKPVRTAVLNNIETDKQIAPATLKILADGSINSSAYNCHTYAWNITLADIDDYGYDPRWPKWDNDPLNNTTGYKPIMSIDAPKQVGDRVLYFNFTYGVLTVTHSGIVSQVDTNGQPTEITSKWGQAGVYKHHPQDVPQSYGVGSVVCHNFRCGYTKVYYRKD